MAPEREEVKMSGREDYRRRLYKGGRPNRLARALNRASAWIHSAGVWPQRLVTLEVRGRLTGRVVKFPLVMADYEGDRYLVSMLGNEVNWVHNIQAAGGRAVLHHGRRESVCLEEVEPSERAPILRRYLACAPGARPHIPVERGAPLEAFAEIAPQIPVFRVTSASQA
jgi:hypothetical protein